MEWLRLSWPALASVLFAPATVIGLTCFSLVCCVSSVVVAAWAVRRLPADYLLSESDGSTHPRFASAGRLLRNALGAVLLVLGVLMLVLPGQGALTIVAALAVMDFRSKRRFEHWLMLQPRVFQLINHLRQRSGHPPLLAPQPTS